ncbi:hypothetical protein QR680_016891 [Steinernema hermaphroditum]|uniref:Uncharacterized protein n=1 Tax=Steinernema hermaphroditum TaxID=289476 RepID=A0AA39HCL8_9BILA|nr:hypothetical protein QR680_016891 [Steinernema hermaphroditum]
MGCIVSSSQKATYRTLLAGYECSAKGAFLFTSSELHSILKRYCLNTIRRPEIYVDPTTQRKCQHEFEAIFDLLADVPFDTILIGSLDQYSRNFLTRQATTMRRLFLTGKWGPEEDEVLSELISRHNLERCAVYCRRKVNFTVIQACVQKWKSDEKFSFSVCFPGRYSTQRIERLFGDPVGKPRTYALRMDGRTRSFIGMECDSEETICHRSSDRRLKPRPKKP